MLAVPETRENATTAVGNHPARRHLEKTVPYWAGLLVNDRRAFRLVMKITLNSAIPHILRASVTEVVNQAAPGAEIVWLPSRFPRLVMLVQPDEGRTKRIRKESIFDSSPPDATSPAYFAVELEERLQRLLSRKQS